MYHLLMSAFNQFKSKQVPKTTSIYENYNHPPCPEPLAAYSQDIRWLQVAKEKLLDHWSNYVFVASRLGEAVEPDFGSQSPTRYSNKQLNSPRGGIKWWTTMIKERLDKLIVNVGLAESDIQKATGLSYSFLVPFENFLRPSLPDF